MNNKFEGHTFHIPVMGIGYTIDTPARVAHLGISSVISLVDDILMEKMREFYSIKFNLPFQAISDKIEDFRAKRITAYLNMIDQIVRTKVEDLKKSFQKKSGEIEAYLDMFPDSSRIRQKFRQIKEAASFKDALAWLKENMHVGSIDVNIMTKLDKENYQKGTKLPIEFNDAHAALRGFANSNLNASVVLSAGMNPKLYSYIEKFSDFFPDSQGNLKKKIILKVSDYRSALIQGNFLARKGLWVSEFRIESGLNCGGHAFATQGNLMGPILEEFKTHRSELIQTLYSTYVKALSDNRQTVPDVPPLMKISAQGGVGTSEEHHFLLDYFNLDSVGWGSPFLLVPESVNIDAHTLEMLTNASEKDFVLSNISPLGVMFNNLDHNTKDLERDAAIRNGNPGSICTKRFLVSNTEFTEKPICTASRQYQKLKIAQLMDQNLPAEQYERAFQAIVEKSCICVGLGTAALLVNKLDHTSEGNGVSICPGPNLAYFKKVISLKEMVSHIYGRINVMERHDRPHVFIKELSIYVEYLKQKLVDFSVSATSKQKEYLSTFRRNLMEGIIYYKDLFNKKMGKNESLSLWIEKLEQFEKELELIIVS